MKTAISLLLVSIVAGIQLLTTTPVDETRRNLRETNTKPHDQETRLSLLDFFVPITSFPVPIPSQSTDDSDNGFIEKTRDNRTIADYICAKENENVTGLFCKLTKASPEIFALLNGTITLTEYYDLVAIPGSSKNTSNSTSNSTSEDSDLISSGLIGVTPRPFGRRLQNNTQFTVFPVDNLGVQELTRRSTNELYNSGDPVVETYFRGTGTNIMDDDAKVDEFIYGPSGRLVRDDFIATAIAVDEIDLNGLNCKAEISMLSNKKVTTECSRRRWLQVGSSKSLGGAKNNQGAQPLITEPDIFVGNGVMHVISGVIEPELETDLLLDNVDYLVEDGNFDKKVLAELAELTGRSFDSTFPPTSTPTANATPEPTSTPTANATPEPTFPPTSAPIPSPTRKPTLSPTPSPTPRPTSAPTSAPTPPPNLSPTPAPTSSPSLSPTGPPTQSPTPPPSPAPTQSPTPPPSLAPTQSPTPPPSPAPTPSPSLSPTAATSLLPSQSPSAVPSSAPTPSPSLSPTTAPSQLPTSGSSLSLSFSISSLFPTENPTANSGFGSVTLLPTSPSPTVTVSPTSITTAMPSSQFSSAPTPFPTASPTAFPTANCINDDQAVISIRKFTGTCADLQGEPKKKLKKLCGLQLPLETCPAICNPTCISST